MPVASINSEFCTALAPVIAAEIRVFLAEIVNEPPDLKALGLATTRLDAVLTAMRTLYQLGPQSPNSSPAA